MRRYEGDREEIQFYSCILVLFLYISFIPVY